MADNSGKIVYRGREYTLVFNLNVMEMIQEEYGTVDAWAAKTDGSSGEVDAKALKYGFMLMLNEGIEIENENTGSQIEPFTLKQAGRIITDVGMDNAAKELNTAVVESVKTDDDGKKE